MADREKKPRDGGQGTDAEENPKDAPQPASSGSGTPDPEPPPPLPGDDDGGVPGPPE